MVCMLAVWWRLSFLTDQICVVDVASSSSGYRALLMRDAVG